MDLSCSETACNPMISTYEYSHPYITSGPLRDVWASASAGAKKTSDKQALAHMKRKECKDDQYP